MDVFNNQVAYGT